FGCSYSINGTNQSAEEAFSFLENNLNNSFFQGEIRINQSIIGRTSFRFENGHYLYGQGICIYLVDENKKDLGFALVRLQNNQIRIAQLRSNSGQGKGIGTGLIAIVAELARHLGAEKIDLSSTTSAIEFYKKIGFLHGEPSLISEHPMYLNLNNEIFLNRAKKMGYFND
ncbi:MAG: GNAT family N-acetyltransferase, partial [Myxococcales bacterium]|nr:GNAT family N-acetyltransferase [Myxococcales bacterium]